MTADSVATGMKITEEGTIDRLNWLKVSQAVVCNFQVHGRQHFDLAISVRHYISKLRFRTSRVQKGAATIAMNSHSVAGQLLV